MAKKATKKKAAKKTAKKKATKKKSPSSEANGKVDPRRAEVQQILSLIHI